NGLGEIDAYGLFIQLCATIADVSKRLRETCGNVVSCWPGVRSSLEPATRGHDPGSQIHIPHDDLPCVASGCRERSIGAERNAPHPTDFPRVGRGKLPGRGVVELHGLVVARRGKVAAGGVECDAREVLKIVIGDATDWRHLGRNTTDNEKISS